MNKIIEDHFKGKPSKMIQATIDGLNYFSQLPNVRINMYTFGHRKSGICYGCAATWAMAYTLKLRPRQAVQEMKWSGDGLVGYSWSDIELFEHDINYFRLGLPKRILYSCLSRDEFLGIDDELLRRQQWYLSTDNWREQLPLIEAYRDKLIALGY